MANLTDALSAVVKEEIPRGIREQRIKLDPVWTDIISTSMGVHREGLGRDWKFLQTYTTGLSGAYQFEANAILEGADTTGPFGTNANQFGAGVGFPDRTETTAPTFFQQTVTLKEARGNLTVPIKWMQMDEFDSSIGSAVAIVLKGNARKAALAHALAFYTSNTANFPIVTNMDTSGLADNAITFTDTIDNSSASDATGRIQMLHVGQTVDMYETGEVVVYTQVPWVVTKVDYLNQTFTIDAIGTETADWATDSADSCFLVPRNSYGNQPSGLNYWTVNTGTIFGLALATHPEFKSLIGTESGPLTEKILTKYIGSFMDRIGTMCDLDTVLTTAGCTHAYLENEDNLARYERNGRRLEIKGGWADIDYAYQGDGFRWAISQFVDPAAAFVVKLNNNIREYVPPATPGTGRQSEFDNEIQFVAQLGGATGVFLHERTATTGRAGVSDNLEAPYFRICELCPEQMQGIKISGLDESEV